jgi:hypothetical protein
MKLFFAESTISGAGDGVFVDSFVQAGTNLGQYKGKMVVSMDSLDNKDYVWRLDPPVHKGKKVYKFLDGHSTWIEKSRNHMAYVNGAANDAQRQLINCQMEQKDGKIYYYSTKDIHPGEELIVDYGRGYFNSRNMGFGQIPFQATKAPCTAKIGKGHLDKVGPLISVPIMTNGETDDGTMIIFWSANPNEHEWGNMQEAYDIPPGEETMPETIINGGVTYTKDNHAVLTLLEPGNYYFNGKLRHKHIHWRLCQDSMMSEVNTIQI